MIRIEYFFQDGNSNEEKIEVPSWLDPFDPDWNLLQKNAEEYFEKEICRIEILWEDGEISSQSF